MTKEMKISAGILVQLFCYFLSFNYPIIEKGGELGNFCPGFHYLQQPWILFVTVLDGFPDLFFLIEYNPFCLYLFGLIILKVNFLISVEPMHKCLLN